MLIEKNSTIGRNDAIHGQPETEQRVAQGPEWISLLTGVAMNVPARAMKYGIWINAGDI